MGLANAQSASSNPRNELRARAAEQPPQGADDRTLAQFYLGRGQAARLLGDSRQAREDLARAHELAKAAGIGLDAFVNARASMETWSGDHLAATAIRADWFSRLERKQWLERLFHAAVLTSYSRNVGNVADARKWHAEAELAFEDAVKAPGWKVYSRYATQYVEAARGHVFQLEGKLDLAAASFSRALRELEADSARVEQNLAKRGESTDTAGYYINRIWFGRELAVTHAQQGRHAEAESTLRELLAGEVRRLGRNSVEVGILTNALAFELEEQGRFGEAGELYSASLASYESAGAVRASRAYTTLVRSLAANRAYEGRWREADEMFGRRASLLDQVPALARVMGRDDYVWGLALVKTARAGEAVPMLQGIVKGRAGEWGADDYRTLERRGVLAVALSSAGRKEDALREFGAVVPQLLEKGRDDGLAEAVSASRRTRLVWILEGYLELLGELHGSTVLRAAGIDSAAESFRIADVARASGVQRAVSAAAARAVPGDPKLAELARGEQDAQQRISILSNVLSRLLGESSQTRSEAIIAGINTEIARLREERRRLWTEITRRFPEYANLIDPRPATLEQARAALREGEALASFYVGTDRTYVWAIPRSGGASFAVVPLGEREAARTVAQLRRALALEDATISRLPRYDVALAHKLYGVLLGPVEEALKDARTLLVVPHHALGQLPFGLLVTAAHDAGAGAGPLFSAYAGVPWLIRKAAIAQLPSVNALVTLRAMPAAGAQRREFIGFGDPYFSKAQQAREAADGAIRPAARSLSVQLRNLPFDKSPSPATVARDGEPGSAKPSGAPAPLRSAALGQLARLPDTAEEIRDISRALNADAARDVFLGARANERNVKSPDLANRKVIAFATHGLVPGDLNGLDQPALALSAPEVADIDGDGLLTLDEILGLKLDADWVVLSACNTASADGRGSEAVSGLGRAFFYAGARSLLVSNWPVETTSARLLTTEIFRRQSRDPKLTRAEALRQSMLDLMGKQAAGGFSYAHPAFWAPFSLVGDGGR